MYFFPQSLPNIFCLFTRQWLGSSEISAPVSHSRRVAWNIKYINVKSVPEPQHFGTDQDPDPALFISDLQDANKKYFFSSSFFAYYFLKVHFFMVRTSELWLTDPDLRGPKTYGSGSVTLRKILVHFCVKQHTQFWYDGWMNVTVDVFPNVSVYGLPLLTHFQFWFWCLCHSHLLDLPNSQLILFSSCLTVQSNDKCTEFPPLRGFELMSSRSGVRSSY